METKLFTDSDWHTSDINVDSLWIIDKRDSSGKHSNVYHGNFIPQIPYQLIKRYTKESDTVLELFTGNGTTELKAVPAHEDNIRQLARYIDWIEQYYIPNRISTIQPVLICKKSNALSNVLKSKFNLFSSEIQNTGILPLKYIEYSVVSNDLFFEEVDYTK